MNTETVSHRNRYQERKADGRCTCCGRPNDRLPKLTCSSCFQLQQAGDYRRWKAFPGIKALYLLICRMKIPCACGMVASRVSHFRPVCLACWKALREMASDRRISRDQKMCRYRASLEIRGLCRNCAKPVEIFGKKHCNDCLREARQRTTWSQKSPQLRRKRALWQKLYRQKLAARGICTQCRKALAAGGSLCISCREKNAAAYRLKKAIPSRVGIEALYGGNAMYRNAGFDYETKAQLCGAFVREDVA